MMLSHKEAPHKRWEVLVRKMIPAMIRILLSSVPEYLSPRIPWLKKKSGNVHPVG